MATRQFPGRRRWKGRRLRRSTLVVRRARRLWHEPLEDRRLLAIITSTLIEDGSVANDTTPLTEQTTVFDPAGNPLFSVVEGTTPTTSTETGTGSNASGSGTTDPGGGTTDPGGGTTDPGGGTTDPGGGTTDPGGGTTTGPTRVSLLRQVIAAPGTSVTVPVNISGDASGLFTADLVIGYDTSVVSTTQEQITAGTLLPGAGIVAVVNQFSGEITISLFSSQPAPMGAAGSLVNIEFDVADTATPGSTTLVDLRSAIVNDGFAVLAVAPRAGADPTDGVIIIDAYQKTMTGRLDLTLTGTPAAANVFTGEISYLPDDLLWIDEWSSFYVEVWASSLDGGGAGLAGGSFDLLYNTDVFTAVAVEFGPAFVGQDDTIDDAAGRIEIAASAAVMNIGVGRPALLAQVRFAATDADPGASLISDRELALAAHDLRLTVENPSINFVGLQADDPVVRRMPETKVIPVVYDVDNNGSVGMSDLSYFAVNFLKHSANPASDYDVSGIVNFADFAWFAGNFGRSQSDATSRVYPDSLIEYWLGNPSYSVPGSSAAQGGDLAQAAPEYDVAQTNRAATTTTANSAQLQPSISTDAGQPVTADPQLAAVVDAPQTVVETNSAGKLAAESTEPVGNAAAPVVVTQIEVVEVPLSVDDGLFESPDDTVEFGDLLARTGLDESAFDTALTDFG